MAADGSRPPDSARSNASTAHLHRPISISTLDPTDRLAIYDWLTDLEAALPSLSYIIQHPERPTVAWFRRLKSISDSTSDTDIQSDYDTFVTTWFDQDRILYGHVLGHVSWRKDSNLKRVIHGHGVEENGASVESKCAPRRPQSHCIPAPKVRQRAQGHQVPRQRPCLGLARH